jgi:hypothetical protein
MNVDKDSSPPIAFSLDASSSSQNQNDNVDGGDGSNLSGRRLSARGRLSTCSPIDLPTLSWVIYPSHEPPYQQLDAQSPQGLSGLDDVINVTQRAAKAFNSKPEDIRDL